MQNPLPECVDFLKQVERDTRYDGVWPVAQLPRLKPSLTSDDGEVHATLVFTTRAGVPCLDGRVQAELELECQRCLENVTTRVEGAFHFGLVSNEDEMALLPAEFEPLLVSEGEQSLIDIIEDELILSLPIVCRHEHECSELLARQSSSDNKQEDTCRPFAGLKDMMRDS